MLGNKVTVFVDRPLGSRHPHFPDMIYPINYGFVEGVLTGDGEEQDAYILGVSKPVSSYTGIVVAILHRLNDVEDKWVVADRPYPAEEIKQAVAFQEQYFKSTLTCLGE